MKLNDRFKGPQARRQQVFDAGGRLCEVHEKYPVDLGHRKVYGEES